MIKHIHDWNLKPDFDTFVKLLREILIKVDHFSSLNNFKKYINIKNYTRMLINQFFQAVY